MPPARLLLISFSPIANDPRVRRQIDLLRCEHDLTVVGYGPYDDPDLEFIPVTHTPRSLLQRLSAAVQLKLGFFDAFYWSTPAVIEARRALSGRRFDLILANDSDSWPLAQAVASPHQTPVLCDAHEYTPREFEDIAWWRFLFQTYKTTLCRRHLPQAAGVLTVCDGIADAYAQDFGLRRPIVVRNAAAHHAVTPVPTPPDRIRIIHHGAAMPSRQIETMLALMPYLDSRFTLDLMLVSRDEHYLHRLKAQAAQQPRVRFLNPVPQHEIVASTREYDIGLFLLPPTNFNYRHALPNKFFEYVQARLAIAIGPSPEMARLVRTHGLGLVADNFTPQALATALNALTPAQIDAFKANAHRAAAVLSWEHERDILRREVQRLLLLPPCVA